MINFSINPRVLAILAVMSLVVTAAAQGPPADREIRTTKDSITGDTLTTLTLMLAGPQGPLPINMAITTTRKAKPGTGSAVEHRLDFDMPMYSGPLDYKTPHVVFDLGAGQNLSYTVDSRAIPPTTTRVTVATFSAADLSRLGRAKTVHGRLFGIEFTLTADQMTAIADFARR